MTTDIHDDDVREFLRDMAAELPPYGPEPPSAIRRAKRRLVRNAAVAVVVLSLSTIGVVSGVQALQASDRKEGPIPGGSATVVPTSPTSPPAASTAAPATVPVGPDVITYFGNDGIAVIRSDGSEEHTILVCSETCFSPAWSPDGSQIAYGLSTGQAGPREGLYVWGLEGEPEQLVSCSNCDVGDAAWSPDGSTIAFTSQGSKGYEIDAVDADGSNLRRLSPSGIEAVGPAWSPDGTRVAFSATPTPDVNRDRLFVMNVDGSGLTKLLDEPGGSGPGAPAWSPDGTEIAYFSTPRTKNGFLGQIWVMSPDGTNRRLLYTSKCCVQDWGGPAWSPDGQSIAFTVETNGSKPPELIVMKADGSHVTPLAEGWRRPSWRPSA